MCDEGKTYTHKVMENKYIFLFVHLKTYFLESGGVEFFLTEKGAAGQISLRNTALYEYIDMYI